MKVHAKKPEVRPDLLDPTGRSLHKEVMRRGYTVDIVRSPGTRTPHFHPGIELIFIHGGPAVWRVDDLLEIALPGEVLVFDAEQIHCTRPLFGQYVRSTIHLIPDALDAEISWLFPADRPGPYRFPLKESAIPGIFQEICRLRDSQRKGTDSKEGWSQIERIFRRVEDAVSDMTPEADHPVLQEIVRYMIDHTSSDDRIDELAKRHFVSTGHLHLLFQNRLGCSPHKLWRAIKMEKACAELHLNDLSVQELAARTGFSSRRGFQRAFKGVTGMSVEDYRSHLKDLTFGRR